MEQTVSTITLKYNLLFGEYWSKYLSNSIRFLPLSK